MNNVQLLIKRGWVVTLRCDVSQQWYYLDAEHETGEASVSASAERFVDALNDLYQKAISATPSWYLNQLKVF